MLKFKSKKRYYIPKFSIAIWLMTLLALVMAAYFKHIINVNHLMAIVPSQIISNIQQSWWMTYKLVSALFIHGNWKHWAGNMILFLIIALPLEKRVGGLWFLLIYIGTGFVGNMFSIYQLHASNHYLLGASGAVSGLLGAWLLLFPRQNISVIIPIGLYLQKAKIPIILLALTWLIIQILFQVLSRDDYSIVWGAHIVGFVAGLCIALLYRISHS